MRSDDSSSKISIHRTDMNFEENFQETLVFVFNPQVDFQKKL